MRQQFHADVTIVGAGVAGLMLSRKLAHVGFKVILIDRSDHLAGGASTKNEGWLHRGTYHATSIANRSIAVQVARRCIYGHEQIRGYAPEAVEEVDVPSYAVLMDASRFEEVVSRWDEAGVSYTAISQKRFAELVPQVNCGTVAAAFRVTDVGINTRLLYRKLLADSERLGTQVFVRTRLSFDDNGQAHLVTDTGMRKSLSSSLYVYTAGYGTKALFQTQFGVTVPMRYWKSHLLVVPRLSGPSVFSLDAHEAAMMNHGPYSIVGLNEDAFRCDEPSFEPSPENVANCLEALRRLFHVEEDLPYLATACTKVDLVERADFVRSINISIAEPVPNHICILPGKMTESPYVTDVATQLIFDRLQDDRVALRPCDKWQCASREGKDSGRYV